MSGGFYCTLLEIDPHRHRAGVGGCLVDTVHGGIRTTCDSARFYQPCLVCEIDSQGFSGKESLPLIHRPKDLKISILFTQESHRQP
jgi:hypothetical protein